VSEWVSVCVCVCVYVYLFRRTHYPFRQALDKDSAAFVLANVQVCSLGLEKVGNDFVVDLQV